MVISSKMFCFFRANGLKGRMVAPLRVERVFNFGRPRLYPDRLLAAYRNRSQPSIAVALFTAHDRVELLLQGLRDRPHRAVADLDLIHRADRRDLGGGA